MLRAMRGDTSDKLIVKLASVLSTGYNLTQYWALKLYGAANKKGDFFVKGNLTARS